MDNEIVMVKKEVKSVQNSLEDISTNVKSIEANNHNSVTVKSSSETSNGITEEHIQEMLTKAMMKEPEGTDISGAISGLNKHMEKVREKMASTNQDVFGMKSQMEVLTDQLTKIKEIMADINDLNSLLKRVDNIEEDAEALKELHEKVLSLNNHLQSMRNNMDTNTDKIDWIQEEILNLKEVFESFVSNEQFELINSKVKELEANNEVLGNMLEGKSELEWVRNQLTKIKNQVKILSDSMSNNDEAMFTKTICASCDKNLVDFQSKPAE